jgi:hypothetical protein
MDDAEIIALAERLGLGCAAQLMPVEVIEAAKAAQAEREALAPLADPEIEPWRPTPRP